MSDPLGHLVEFVDKGRMVLGMVQSAKKGRLAVLTAGDRQEALPEKRVLWMAPAALSPERPRDALVAYLRREDARRDELAGQVDVAQLWELVHEESAPLPLSDLAELHFGKPLEAAQVSATLRALFNERVHFRLAADRFEPLAAEQLEAKLLQMEREAAQQAEMDAYLGYLAGLPQEGECPPPPPGLAALLSDLVVHEDAAPQAKKAKEVVSLAGLGGREQVFDLLVRLGVYRPHQSLELLRDGISEQFAPAVLDAARFLRQTSFVQGGREDFTGLATFTIDGAFSSDFDDALSFEPSPDGGGVVGVHITDAGSLLAMGSELDQEARCRGTSIYLPEGRIPMLPPELSEDSLSLRQGELRPGLSCLATLDAEGQVRQWRLARSILRVARRLTYDEADGLLESDSALAGLRRAMQAFRRWRAAQGAYFLPLPELIMGVDEDWQVWAKRVDRDGPSREMVAETAIMANWLKAGYLAEHGLPALYRTQPPPREPIVEGQAGDLFFHFRQRRLLNRVEITLEPGLHAMLGLSPYTHVTSPIRRYLDLVVQRQLGAALAGETPPYDAESLRGLAMEVEPVVRRAGKVRQARQRYWLLRWLQARKDEALPALVMEFQVRRWQFLLTDIMLLVTIPVAPGLSLEPGQEVQMRVVKVDPFNDILRMALA